MHVSLQNSRLVKVNSPFVRGNIEHVYVDMNGNPQQIQRLLSIGM